MTPERIAMLVLGALNVGAGALLAAADGLPIQVKLAVVVTQAVAVWTLAQIKSWDDAAPPLPHG